MSEGWLNVFWTQSKSGVSNLTEWVQIKVKKPATLIEIDAGWVK